MSVTNGSVLLISCLLCLTAVSCMNKLVFLDNNTNVEIGVRGEYIVCNFKHNIKGFIILAFGDTKKELVNKDHMPG